MHRLFVNRILIFATLTVLALSCKKEPDLLGLDLIPQDELLSHEYTDTTTVIAYTVKEDTLRTDELATSLLGTVNDPVYGVTTASIYSQFRMPALNISFGSNPVADSIILTIPYKGIYGDTLATQSIKVYELDDTLNMVNPYYHFSTIPVKPVPIGEATFVPDTRTTDTVNGVAILPHMRIQLTQEFANRLITADSTTLATNTNFLKEFKGIYLTSDASPTVGNGAIMYLDPGNSQAKISLHFHNSADTSKIDFVFGSNTARFNNYNHYDYEGADPLLIQQFGGDTLAGNEKLFLQSMGGAKIKLRFPHIDKLAEQNIPAIHEAVLVIENDQPDDKYPMPALAAIRVLDENGKYEVLPDEAEGSAYIGGQVRNNKEYRIRVTRYIQQRLLNPELPDYGLIILAAGSSLSANRAVLKGTGAETGRMRLLIYYTPLE